MNWTIYRFKSLFVFHSSAATGLLYSNGANYKWNAASNEIIIFYYFSRRLSAFRVSIVVYQNNVWIHNGMATRHRNKTDNIYSEIVIFIWHSRLVSFCIFVVVVFVAGFAVVIVFRVWAELLSSHFAPRYSRPPLPRAWWPLNVLF